jgi:hypothetical protein
MENEPHDNIVFNIEDCQAKKRMAGLFDCLSSQQAPLCGFSMGFGEGYFCKHPRRNEFVENVKKTSGKIIDPLPDVSQSDD